MSLDGDRIDPGLSIESNTGQTESNPCVEMSEGVARYLMALFDLGQKDEPLTQARLARELEVSQPSALQMVRRIREMGLINDEDLGLTPAGMSAALVLTSRRTAATDLTAEVLGLDPVEARAEAEHLASSATPAFGRKLVAWRKSRN
ncbi:MAG: DtxR family transcriptional regulator, Mn-dependent transcriptional regulator [Actinomycetota bacterium]|jgi:Mn-dependent DtxR family transcriptional regulator|nr:DtxR family transcriptional regulator, Mn-dependent transcriptional regulator [Actinomycetota bacterium]